jgi:hypothetical protein
MNETVKISASPKYDSNGNCYYELEIPTGGENSINATLSCETIIPSGCSLDLFTFLLNEVDSSIDPDLHLVYLLDRGVAFPKSILCCPSCGPYFIGSIDAAEKLLEGFSNCAECCISAKANEQMTLQLQETLASYGLEQNYPCDNDFTSKINALLSEMNSNPDKTYDVNDFLDKGVIEYGSLNADLSSSINKLRDFLYSADFDETEDVIFNTIIEKGLVLHCTQYWTIVASVETFLKYAEALGLCIQRPN